MPVLVSVKRADKGSLDRAMAIHALSVATMVIGGVRLQQTSTEEATTTEQLPPTDLIAGALSV